MRKALVAVLVIVMVSVAAVSYAHMRGGGGGYGSGYGMSRGGNEVDQKKLDETYDLRKTFHDKKFEYREALRKGDEEKLEALEKEIEKLKEELYEKTGMTRGGKEVDQKKLDETYDLRKKLHDKKFEYREARRKGDKEKLEALEKEIEKLKEEFYEKTGITGKKGKRGKKYGRRGYGPRGGYDSGGYGDCGGPGYGGQGGRDSGPGYGDCGCGGPGGWR
jgi:Spy/CpxP family protein refolding chaperone